MNLAVSDQLEQNMECEGMLECFFDITELDREVFDVLTGADHPFTVEQVAETIDRERSTAYRSLQRLVDAGVVQKEQVNYDDGGYYHVFEPVSADQVVATLHRNLNEWYRKMDALISEFERKYDRQSAISEDA